MKLNLRNKEQETLENRLINHFNKKINSKVLLSSKIKLKGKANISKESLQVYNHYLKSSQL